MTKFIAVALGFLLCASTAFAEGCSLASGGAQAESGVTGASTAVVNTICPVSGEKISADTTNTVDYQGKRIGFCCPACIPAFKADPEKYLAKLK